MTSRSPDIEQAQGAPRTPGRPARLARRWRPSWLRALPLLARYITRTMPWATLITSCLAGLAAFTMGAESGKEWGVLAAGTLLVMAPLAVAFIAFQRRFVDSFVFSGVKG